MCCNTKNRCSALIKLFYLYLYKYQVLGCGRLIAGLYNTDISSLGVELFIIVGKSLGGCHYLQYRCILLHLDLSLVKDNKPRMCFNDGMQIKMVCMLA